MFVGTWRYHAGTSGTLTVTPGATVVQIIVHATGAGSMTIFGGDSIPIPAGGYPAFRFNHWLLQARNNATLAGSQDIVFTGTDSYYVESFAPGQTSNP